MNNNSFGSIPDYLKQNALWCVWKLEQVKDRTAKVPFNPITGKRAKSNDKTTFGTFDDADMAYQLGGYTGLGIGIFGTLCAVDIDHCFSAEGELSAMAADIVSTMQSYTEISPSGSGIRIMFTADDIDYDKRFYINNQKAGLEVYIAGKTNKYVTITGNVYAGLPVENRSAEIMEIAEKYMRRTQGAALSDSPHAPAAALSSAPASNGLSDDALLRKALNSQNGALFNALWHGDTSGYANDDSRADLALCNMLSFWAGKDAAQIDRIFRQSGLMRPKWDEKRSGEVTYGELTVQKAIESTSTVYTGKAPAKKAPQNAPVVFNLPQAAPLTPQSPAPIAPPQAAKGIQASTSPQSAPIKAPADALPQAEAPQAETPADAPPESITSLELIMPEHPPQPYSQGEPVYGVKTIDNIYAVLVGTADFRGKIWQNTFAHKPWIIGRLPWAQKEENREWTNSDDAQLRRYLEFQYGVSSPQKVDDALAIAFAENKYSPLQTFLKSLVWDGKPHIENLLTDFLGVEKTRYSAESMRVFMLAAVARAFKPGTKFDYMLVLTGSQGIGKSTFFRRLACFDDWFTDAVKTIDNPDKAFEGMQGHWIVEMAELGSIKRSADVETVKAFITAQSDTYRVPYEKRPRTFPRQCVFGGTTNSNRFLVDKTGSRRFLPQQTDEARITKNLFDDADLAEFRQAWAEAMHIYNSGKFHLTLSAPSSKDAKKMQDAYTEEDMRTAAIAEYLETYEGERVCVMQLWQDALGMQGRPSRRETGEIHDIMTCEIKSWQRLPNRQRCEGYGVVTCYARKDAPPPSTDALIPDNL